MTNHPTLPQLGTVLLTVVVVLVTASATTGLATSGLADRSPNVLNQHEPNDSFDTATQISTPYERTGLEASIEDTDIYAVTLQPGTWLNVSISFSDQSGDLDLYVFDPNEDLLAASTSITDDEDASIRAGVAGTYYIGVVGWANTSTTYSMTATHQTGQLPPNDDFEYNDGFTTATNISPTFTRAELRITPTEYDIYAVELPSMSRFTVTASFNDTIADIELRFYNESESLRGFAQSSGDNETIIFNTEESGTFYIEVYSADDNAGWYTLNLTTTPLEDITPTTTTAAPTSTTTTTEATPTESMTTTGTDGPGFTILLAVAALLLTTTIAWLRRD